MSWTVYLIECGDGSLYCGVTTDLQKRLRAHKEGRGAKYTRGRGPLKIVFHEAGHGHGDALRREIEIKKLTKDQKLELIRQKGCR